jgi:acetylglutamate kinase
VKVIKLGGSLLDDASRRAAALEKIVQRWNAGEDLVLVHGGGKHIDAAMAKLGLAKRTHAGLRITDDATLGIVVSVLGGSVNKMLVSELTALGVRAAGISGCDGATLIAEKHADIDGVDLGHVGKVTGSNRALVNALLTTGTMPVISSIAIGLFGDSAGALFNVNADSAATAIAIAHGAKELTFLTDVPGLLDEEGNVVPHLNAADAQQFLVNVTGGMKPKLHAAINALVSGVQAISIGEEGGTTLVAA